jgi:hypothetical protein
VHGTYRVFNLRKFVRATALVARVCWVGCYYVNCFCISLRQMLFYESAACLHGRRQILRGKYYASAFTHYQPVDPKVWHFKTEVGIRSCRWHCITVELQ